MTAPVRPEQALPRTERVAQDTCDICASSAVEWRKCKLICRGCGNIVKSCADL